MKVKCDSLQLEQDFHTEGGGRLPRPVVAYETYGNPAGEVIFIAHGGLSDHHAAGRYSDDDPLPGWWDALIGPGKVFDTDRYRVICSNALGSMYGTTGPNAVNPETGCRYGPLFPAITLADQVRFQKAFLDTLGVQRLRMMAGPSMGSLQSLQMAALYPELVGGVVSVATAGRMPPSGIAFHHFMRNAIEMDPDFRGGWYEPGTPLRALRLIHQVMKIYYTHEKAIKTMAWDPVPEGPGAQDARAAAINAFLCASSDADIARRDPNAYRVLLDAINSYDLGRDSEDFTSGVRRIQCPVLLMNLDTDQEFPQPWADEVAEALNAHNPGQARAVELTSQWGHLGCIREFEQMEREIRAWFPS